VILPCSIIPGFLPVPSFGGSFRLGALATVAMVTIPGFHRFRMVAAEKELTLLNLWFGATILPATFFSTSLNFHSHWQGRGSFSTGLVRHCLLSSTFGRCDLHLANFRPAFNRCGLTLNGRFFSPSTRTTLGLRQIRFTRQLDRSGYESISAFTHESKISIKE
jgi:hypothetical protein